MPYSQIQACFDEQIQLLTHQRIIECENRRGLRWQTGSLLEAAFLELAAGLKPDLSVEIGAHEASFSICIKRLRPQVQALAFEANPYVFEKFSNAPDNTLKMIEYKNVAICDRTGFVDLHIPTLWPQGAFGKTNAISSLLPRINQGFKYETIRVPSSTLDEAVANIDFSTAVAWIDTEGAQRDVVTGGSDFFTRASAVYIEVETKEVWAGQPLESEISKLLGRHGFMPVLRDNLAKIQFNVIYIKPGDPYIGILQPIIKKYLNDIRSLLN